MDKKKPNILHAIITTMIMLFAGFSANAQYFIVDGINYNITSDKEKTVEVIYGHNLGIYSGDIVIPESVVYDRVEYSVTSIGDSAFEYCEGLTSVEIPNSVTSIGEWAFANCGGLTSIEIPNSVTSIGRKAFQSCYDLTRIVVEEGNSVYDSRENCNAIIETETNKLISGCKNSFIPNTVTSIGESAFFSCEGLTSIEIPNSVTSIGDYAFRDCYELTNVTIGNSVTSIGVEAFTSCEGLTNVTIGNSVTSIGLRAFWHCYSLTSIEIPNSVTSIGESAFAFCECLTNVTIGNSVTWIEERAFQFCKGLRSIEIPNSVTWIGDSAFEYCEGLTNVTIGNSVTSIDNNIFSGCFNIVNIVVDEGNSVYDSRENCNAIIETKTNKLISGCKNSFIPNTVTSIGKNAFLGCKGLTSIEIPNSVTSIGLNAFYSCYGLTRIVVEEGNSVYDSRENCNAIIETETNKLISGCKNSFIPNSVTSIGDSAFSGCKGLISIEIPNSVTSIGDRAFNSCEDLRSIEIPNSVTSIGDRVFAFCEGLRRITIPASIKSVGDSMFGSSLNIKNIYLQSAEVPTAYDTSIFDPELDKSTVDLYVPVGSATLYAATYGWNQFNIIEYEYNNIERIETTDKIIIFSENGKIVIDSNVNGEAKVVNIDGIVDRHRIEAGRNEIEVGSGLYIVKFNNKTVKLLI